MVRRLLLIAAVALAVAAGAVSFVASAGTSAHAATSKRHVRPSCTGPVSCVELSTFFTKTGKG